MHFYLIFSVLHSTIGKVYAEMCAFYSTTSSKLSVFIYQRTIFTISILRKYDSMNYYSSLNGGLS